MHQTMKERLLAWAEEQTPHKHKLTFHQWNYGMRSSLPAPEDVGQGDGLKAISVDEYFKALGWESEDAL